MATSQEGNRPGATGSKTTLKLPVHKQTYHNSWLYFPDIAKSVLMRRIWEIVIMPRNERLSSFNRSPALLFFSLFS